MPPLTESVKEWSHLERAAPSSALRFYHLGLVARFTFYLGLFTLNQSIERY